MKILIIKQSSLGDIIHSTIALEAIKKKFPKSEIHFLIDFSLHFVLKSHPAIDKFYFIDRQSIKEKAKKKKFLSLFKELKKCSKELKKTKFDLAFDLQGIERSAYFLYACKSKKKFIKSKRYPFLKGYKLPNKDDHALKEIAGVLKLAQIPCPTTIKPKLFFKQENLNSSLVNSIFLEEKEKAKILINPFTTWQSKNIPLEKILEIASLIHSKASCSFIIIGTPDEKEFTQEKIQKLIKNYPKSLKNCLKNIVGETKIKDLPQMIMMSDCIISGEGGIIHMANALNKPNCVIFGPTSIKRVGPWQKNSLVTQHPFPKAYHHKRNCPPELWNKLNTKEISENCLSLITKNYVEKKK